jgi:predicted transposase/invertase (TIGR01784 family)
MNLKTYRDNKNVIDFAYDEGKAEGLLEGKAEGRLEEKRDVVRSARLMGLPVADIAKLTGLSEDDIRAL